MTNINKEIENEAQKSSACNHFMVWNIQGGYSYYRCDKCNHIDGQKTFADIVQKAREEERERLEKVIENKRYTNEQIKDIGKSWIGHPCQGYNQAIEDVLQALKNN